MRLLRSQARLVTILHWRFVTTLHWPLVASTGCSIVCCALAMQWCSSLRTMHLYLADLNVAFTKTNVASAMLTQKLACGAMDCKLDGHCWQLMHGWQQHAERLLAMQVLADHKASLANLQAQKKVLDKETAARKEQLARFEHDWSKANTDKTAAKKTLQRLQAEQQDTYVQLLLLRCVTRFTDQGGPEHCVLPAEICLRS